MLTPEKKVLTVNPLLKDDNGLSLTPASTIIAGHLDQGSFLEALESQGTSLIRSRGAILLLRVP